MKKYEQTHGAKTQDRTF